MTEMRDLQVCCLLLPLAFAFPGTTFGQPVPRILSNGIVSAAGAPLPPAPVAPGGIISIYGSNFNSASGVHAGGTSANVAPLPTNINGTQVLINSIYAPLYYVDSSQVNAQVPWEVNGASVLSVQVIVNANPSNLATVALAPSAPGLLVVTHTGDGSLVTASNPAAIGEYLTIYGVGFGPVSNPPATGAAAVAAPLSSSVQSPVVTMGGVVASVPFSGLAPGFAGLYQINAKVPAGTPFGNDVTVALTIGSVISNTLTISVQAATPSGVQVSLAPTSASLITGATQQFSASVSGTDNSALNWTVNGIPGGSAAVGTISTNGLYTAPAAFPGSTVVFVAATSAADLSSAGTATVTVSPPPPTVSPLGRFRSSAPGLWTQFEDRGATGGYYSGQMLHNWNDFEPAIGSTVAQEVALQLDKMNAMDVRAITFAVRTSKATDTPDMPFVPPECPENSALGLNWPQPTPTELTNLRAFFDLVQSKGMKIRLGLVNTHMEEQPPTNSTTWLGAIAGAIGNHPALDVITLDGTPLLVPSTPSGPPDKCGVPAEAALWYGPGTITTQYIQWAMGYLESLGVPAKKLSAEAIAGNYLTDSMSTNSCLNCATDGHFWNPVTTLKLIFDQVGIPDNQRTYALSFYEHTKCTNVGSLPCRDLDPHTWAEQTLQTMYGIIGTGNGARVIATEMGDNTPVDPTAWGTSRAMESLATLMDKYQIEGGSFWRWASFTDSEDSDPTLANPVKIRGLDFVYNPVQKEILDWAGFHLAAIPNASFEDDVDSNAVPIHWAVTGKGSAFAYYLPQEPGQPEVPSRGSYCLRLTSSDSSGGISALSDRIPVSPGIIYTTTANLRFAWSGDPNPTASSNGRPQVFVTMHYLDTNGQPASVPSTTFPYFQEDSTQGFQTFVFRYAAPSDAQFVQIELGAARNGLAAPITVDVDNLR